MGKPFDLASYIAHHLADSDKWNLPFLKPIQLPAFLSLHCLMILIASVLLIILFVGIYDKKSRVPTGITNLLESFVLFIRNDVAIINLGEENGKKMTPLLCTYFFFILTLNLMGMIPLFSTATANINVTAGLAFVTLSFMTFGTIYTNGVKGFFSALCPSGVPGFVLVILFPIELLGVIIKCFALMIRLFANILAGHIVIISLLGIVVSIGAVALPAVLLGVGIYVLELFVAFLQAYIFTLLSAMFIGQMMYPDH